MRLADVIAILDRLYDPRWAEPWDRVGLVCGDPEAEVRRIVEQGRAAPGHVFNLGHGVLPETDPDVLTRVVDLLHHL